MVLHQKTNILAAFLLLFVLSSCSSPEKPEQLMRRLMESKIQGGKFDENHTDSTATIFSSQADSVEHYLEGRQRIQKDYLIITLHENITMQDWYWTGVFRNEEGTWKSLFDTELVRGKLEKIIDLNGDGSDVMILDEYEGNSAGFDSHQFLYGKKDKPYLEKIEALSRRLFPGNAYSGIQSEITYKSENDHTVILVSTKEFDTDSEGKTSSVQTNHTYRWQPPELIDVSTAAANSASSTTFDGFLAEALRCGIIMENSEPGEGAPSLEFALDLPHPGFERTLMAVYNASEDNVCVSLYTSEEGSNHYYLVAWIKNQTMPQILEVGETNFGGSDEKWEKCKIEPIPCGSECYTSAWKVTTSLGEGDSYKYQVRLFSLTDVGFVDTTDKQLQDFLTGNFVVFWDQEEKIEPGSYLEGGVGWPGGTVLFFNANHEVFGNATGFDMDSHRFKGEYKIDSEKKDKSESVYKIILAGKRVYYVEGEAEAHRSQLSNTELQLLFKDGRVFLSGFSMLDGSEKPLVTLQGLSKKEIDQARASYLKMDSTINEFFSK